MNAAADHRAQVQALRQLYRPKEEGHAGQGVTFGEAQTSGHQLRIDDNPSADLPAHLRRVRGLLPTIVTETRVALDCARDTFLTGGIEVEDGKRLRTAYERLKRIAEVVAAAEREVHG